MILLDTDDLDILQIPFLMFSRVGEGASTIYKNALCSLMRADHTFCVFTNGRGRFYYSQKRFLPIGTRAGSITCVFTSGRRRFYYSQNVS